MLVHADFNPTRLRNVGEVNPLNSFLILSRTQVCPLRQPKATPHFRVTCFAFYRKLKDA